MFPSRCRILRAGQKDEPTFVFLWGKIPCVSPSPLPLLDVPGRPRQYRSQQKYERLLGAGLHAFDRRGYDQATVDAIAAEAKVSTGTFYRFFRDKRQLLLVLVGEQLDLLDDELRAFDLSTDPLSAIETLLLNVTGEAWGPSCIWRAWQEARLQEAELRTSHRKIDAWIRDALTRAMDRVGEEGGLRLGLDREAATRAISALLWGVMDSEYRSQAIRDAVVRLIYHALFVDQTDRPPARRAAD